MRLKLKVFIVAFALMSSGCTSLSREVRFTITSDSIISSREIMNDLREKNVVNAKDYIEFLNIADKTRPFIDAGLKDIQEDGKLDHKEYLLKILPHVNDIVRMRLLGESNEHRPGDAISDSE